MIRRSSSRRPGEKDRFKMIGACLLGAAAIFLGACQSEGGKTTPAPSRPQYMDEYSDGHFSEAFSLASAASKRPDASDAEKEQAMLIAGLSAQAMNRNSEAEIWLARVSTSSDPLVSGKAQAALGLIAKETGSPEKAAPLLLAASDKLIGDDAARAAMYAGDAFWSQGKSTEATAAYKKADAAAKNDAALKRMIGERLAGKIPSQTTGDVSPGRTGGNDYCVQAGSYSTKTQANAQATRLRNKAMNAGLGVPRVVPVVRNGKTLYQVRIGRFTDRPAADRARAAIGGDSIVGRTQGE